MNQREFADLIGVSQPWVASLIKRGILNESVTRKGRLTIIDPKLAIQEIKANRDPRHDLAEWKDPLEVKPKAKAGAKKSKKQPPKKQGKKKTDAADPPVEKESYQVHKTEKEKYQAKQKS